MKRVKGIKDIAKELNMDSLKLFDEVLRLNKTYELDIDQHSDLDDWQYNLIKAVLSEAHLVRSMRKDKGFSTVYNYRNNPNYATVANYVQSKNLNGLSTSDVMKMTQEECGQFIGGTQMYAFCMREAGYESKVVYSDYKQCRRWYKEGYVAPDRENTYNAMKEYVKWNSIEGLSMEEIQRVTNHEHITPQLIASSLRQLGFVTKLVKLESGNYVRRWFRSTTANSKLDEVEAAVKTLTLDGVKLSQIRSELKITDDFTDQQLARVLKQYGYKRKTAMLVDGTRARLWYKPDQTSFF